MIYSLNLYKPLNYERRKYLNNKTTNTVPIWEKSNMTLAEAADYSGVGINRLRTLSDDKNCPFVLWVGSKRLIKRRKLDEYLERQFSI